MIKKIYLAVSVLIVVSVILFMLKEKTYACQEQVSISPIFGKNETSLQCIRCVGNVESNRNSEITKAIKSNKVTYITEIWKGNKKVLHIDRWYFEHPEDAYNFPFSGVLMISSGFPGWKDESDPKIGDETCWIVPFCVYFTKGKVLVRVTDASKNFDRNFLIEIARSIEKKL